MAGADRLWSARVRHRMSLAGVAAAGRRSGVVGFGPDRPAARNPGRLPAGAVDCDQPAEQRRSGRLSANGSASAASSTAWNTPTTCCPMCAAAPQTGTIDQGKLQGILTVDFDKLAGWNGLTLLRQLLPDPQHRPHPARLCRRHQHHRRDRGGADHAAVGAVARAEFRRRQGEPEGRPARRRHRVLLQRTQHHVPAERLADDRGGEPAERRRGLSAVHARRPPQGRSGQERVAAARRAQRRSGRAGPGRRAASQPLRAQFPRQRSALRHRRGAVPAQHGQEGRGACHHAQARRLGALRRSSTTSALPSTARCSPIRRAPAWRSSTAATSGSMR